MQDSFVNHNGNAKRHLLQLLFFKTNLLTHYTFLSASGGSVHAVLKFLPLPEWNLFIISFIVNVGGIASVCFIATFATSIHIYLVSIRKKFESYRERIYATPIIPLNNVKSSLLEVVTCVSYIVLLRYKYYYLLDYRKIRERCSCNRSRRETKSGRS